MTKIKFTRENSKLVAVECEGHCEYAEEGEDIVCAALSSIVQTAVLGIMNLVVIQLDYSVDAERGFLKAKVDQTLTEQQAHDVDLIFRTAYLGVSDLYENYSDFISLEVV